MIITELNGGLGNQMFQFACGRAFSLRSGTELLMDETTLLDGQKNGKVTPRHYELGIFTLGHNRATAKQRRQFFPENIVRKGLRKIFNYNPVITEGSNAINDFLVKKTSNAFLRGYWQSEKYFQRIEKTIRKDLEFSASKSEQTKAWAEKINASTAVSVHIRRGDYAENEHTKNFHGLLGISYYEKAMSVIEQQKINNLKYYFFSDDAEWVKKEIIKDNKNYFFIGHNTGADNWQDMYLMSCCKHHIIANSSFSWWGAWLNTDENKMVIAPKNWFAHTAANDQTRELIPMSWHRI